MLDSAELNYLELTAKHAPHELPASAPLVARLIEYAESLHDQVETLEDQLATAHDALAELRARTA